MRATFENHRRLLAEDWIDHFSRHQYSIIMSLRVNNISRLARTGLSAPVNSRLVVARRVQTTSWGTWPLRLLRIYF